MLRLLPDILTNASNQDPTIGTGEKDQTSRTRFWIWVAGSRSGSERRLHGALLLLASGDGQHFRATFAASQRMNQPVQSRERHEHTWTTVHQSWFACHKTSQCQSSISQEFLLLRRPYIEEVLNMLLKGMADDASSVRETAFKALGWGLELHGFAMRLSNCRRPKQSRSILDLPIQRFCCHLWRRPVLVSWCPAETSTCKMLWYVVVSRWWKIIGQNYSMITDDSCCFSVVLWAFPSTRVCLMWPGSFDMVLCS